MFVMHRTLSTGTVWVGLLAEYTAAFCILTTESAHVQWGGVTGVRHLAAAQLLQKQVLALILYYQ